MTVKSTRSALFYSFLDRYSGLVVTLATSMVLARLLKPSEIGVFSVTMVFLGIVSTIRDMGAGQYLVREPELTEEKVRATRTIQLGIGVALAVLTLALAKPISAFYDEAAIERIMWVLAANFVVIPFGSIIVALWTRELKFSNIAIMRFVGAIVGSLTGITLAFEGHGAISLAWAAVATQLSGVVVAYLLWRGEFTLLPGIRGIYSVFSFGSRLTLYSIIRSVTQGAPEMILGRLQDMTQTGFLSRGQGLVALFDRLVMDGISSVIFPVFSKTLREGGDLGGRYVEAIGLVTAIGWAFFGVLAISAFPVIRILYGDQWDEAVLITQTLCVVASLNLPIRLTGTVLITKGCLKKALILASLTGLITVTGCLIGASRGLEELGFALAGTSAINLLLWLHVVYKEIPFSLTGLLNILLKNIALATLAALPFVYIYYSIGFRGSLADLAYLIPAALASAVLFAMVSRLMKHPIYREFEIAFSSVLSVLNQAIIRR